MATVKALFRAAATYPGRALCWWKLSLAAVFVAGLLSCSTHQPELSRLYRTAQNEQQAPVILIHGAFGARLCDSAGREHWPGNLLNILFADYRSLALAVPGDSGHQPPAPLSVCGLTDTVAGKDFYGNIEATLTGPGGYLLSAAGTPVTTRQRRYYRYVYDWRQDNSKSAAGLDALVNQIREDHGNPQLQVDIVAHSMGGLITRYWLRYGVADVLDSNDFPLNNSGAAKARKVILVGTPNLGSTSALQQLLTGADFGVNNIRSETLLTFPSAYQLLPHPIVDSVLGTDGQPLGRDIYAANIWQALQWGPFDPTVQARLHSEGWTEKEMAALTVQVGKQLERARRFVWSLSVRNETSVHELIIFGGDCLSTPARILIEDIDDESHVRLWPAEVKRPLASVDYQSRMLEPGDGAVTKASLLARTELDPSIARHMYSDFPLDYAVMFCGDHSELPGNITFQDNLLHILLSR